MDIGELLKDAGYLISSIVGLLASCVALYKISLTATIYRHTITKDQYYAMAELLSKPDVAQDPLLVEETFFFRFKKYIPYTVISLLRTYVNPSEAIRLFLSCRTYIDANGDGTHFVYKGMFANEYWRKMWSFIGLFGYWACALLSLSMIAVTGTCILAKQYSMALMSAFFVIGLVVLAYSSLSTYLGISFGIKLVENKLPRRQLQATRKRNKKT